MFVFRTTINIKLYNLHVHALLYGCIYIQESLMISLSIVEGSLKAYYKEFKKVWLCTGCFYFVDIKVKS